MKISIDTKEDSHEEIRKVINMLQNIVGESQVFSNQPMPSDSSAAASPFANIFGDASASSEIAQATSSSSVQPLSEESSETTESAKQSESTEDLFAELFSEEELKKMDATKVKDEEEDEEEELDPKSKPKSKRPEIEFY